jgi:tetratricopeptide (TPR) repeat protein
MTDFDFLSDDFDIDAYLANEEKREEIEQLDQLARDCRDELQYAKAEKFYQRAAELAEEINDLSLMLKERFWLAAMQGMQGKYQAALQVFTWLIGVAYDAEQSRKLDEDDLWYVAEGFMNFVEVGRYLPEMQAGDLERVIDRGIDWLASIGKGNWSDGLRLQRGLLWQAQGRQEAALSELEAALALHRRQPDAPGYTLGSHLLNLGDVLIEMERLEEAEGYYREVAEGHEFSDYEQLWAWKGLAYVALARQDWAEAETCALKSLELARGIEALQPICYAYDVLGTVYYKQERLSQCIEAKIQTWRYARQDGEASTIYGIYRDMAEIRIYQAKQGNPQRYIAKARRWLQWALPLAVRLDRQVGLTKWQDKIRQLQAECDAILRDSATGDN